MKCVVVIRMLTIVLEALQQALRNRLRSDKRRTYHISRLLNGGPDLLDDNSRLATELDPSETSHPFTDSDF